jgi:phage-related baseplate assembly protein
MAALTLAAGSSSIDLSRLPAPQVVQALNYEAILAARLADLAARVEGFTALLESDPAVKLQETDAYRELLDLAAINDRAAAVMLAFARGSDLDHLGALFSGLGLARLELEAATDTTPAVMESDDAFRRRIQLAPEELARTGLTGGAYVSRALRSSAKLGDVVAIKRGGGQVDVVLLALAGDGTLEAADVATVARAFADDAAVQLTDFVNVRAATVVPFRARVTLFVPYGPDKALIEARADKAVRAYAERQHKIGRTVYRQMIEAAASVSGVEKARAELAIGDADFTDLDVVAGEAGAAFLAELEITVEVVA